MSTVTAGTRTPKRFEERIDRENREHYLAVFERGAALKDDPLLNKGTCFTRREREELGLLGLLPPRVAPPAEQERRAYGNYLAAGDDIHRYLFLAALQDRNETLFCRLLVDHLEEMAPIVYTPTVGQACERYSHIYRRARGLYVSSADRGRIVPLLRNAPHDDVRVIVVTDNEAILGIGDQGVGGMGIAIGKLALYSAGAGIHPALCMPIDFDVGTDNAALLEDPLYLGVRERRLRGDAYYSLLDELVATIGQVWPRALVQWEDFANRNAFTILERYRRKVLSFNDDIQGTGAVVVAGIRTGVSRVGRRFEDERVVIFGAGAAGAGSALAVRAAMAAAGVPVGELDRHVLCLDSRGLIVADRPGLEGQKLQVACSTDLVAGWTPGPDGGIPLAEVVRRFAPMTLIGASGKPGSFTEDIVRSMHVQCARPIILPLSNPTAMIEANPADLIRWTGGAAVVGTGSPFSPVAYGSQTYEIGQGNNALVFPGIGLGAIAVEARWLPDEAFSAASEVVAEVVATWRQPGAPMFPPLARLRDVSRAVALAVARTLVAHHAATAMDEGEIELRLEAATWEPNYLPYRAG